MLLDVVLLLCVCVYVPLLVVSLFGCFFAYVFTCVALFMIIVCVCFLLLSVVVVFVCVDCLLL